MKGMKLPPHKAIWTFLGRFLVLYVILTLPWPGGDRLYGEYFRTLCRLFFHDDDRREIAFKNPAQDSPRPLDTRIEIANRALLHADESGPVRNVDLDARNFAWEPMALLLALTIATPLPWRRRMRALLGGSIALHVLLLLFLSFCIWDESAEIGLVTFSPFWKAVADGFREFLRSEATIALPPIIWVLFTIRREDAKGLFSGVTHKAATI